MMRAMSTNNTAKPMGADTPSAVTLLDVARAAGVSKSTVSRVLDERIPPSRSATARRVREVANELGYRRNTYASNLRRGATATIGVVVPRLSDTVMALMFEAIERAALRRGYFAIVATSGDEPAELQRQLLSDPVGGLCPKLRLHVRGPSRRARPVGCGASAARRAGC